MEDATKMLEAKFQKAESDLNHLSRKLELRCQNSAEGDSRKNPTELLQKVEAVKKEYKSLVQEAAEIQRVQTDAMEYFRTQLPLAMQLLQQLQMRTTSEGCEDNQDKINELVSLLGIQVPAPTVVTSSNPSTQITPGTAESQPQVGETADDQSKFASSSSPVDSKDSTHGSADLNAGLDDPVAVRAALRASSSELVEVSQEEFDSVSELIRGRVKLSEVNASYRVLWRHFKEQHNSNPLSPAEMHKMGMRVTGATGKAKLKVLRALKLLTISPKEEVKLV